MTTLTPAEQQKMREVATQVSSVVEAARAIEVQTPKQAACAAGFLQGIAQAKRQSEAARKLLVGALNDHVKTINDQFRPKAESLDEADGLVREKVLAFQQEQERQRAAEQARLDAIRREEEEKAEAERRRLAQEAAEAERIAAEAERQRQAEIAAQAGERRNMIAAMDDAALNFLAFAPSSDASEDELRMAHKEIEARKAAREAQEYAALARQEAEDAQQREIAVKSTPALAVAAPTALAGISGRTEWKGTVIDPSQVPEEYKIIDQKKINAVVKAGVRSIPGVKIEQVSGLAVRAK
jgi:hypothetical protein